jgi:hypothetical protein
LRFSPSHGSQARNIEEERRLRQELRVVEECDVRVRRAVLGLSRLPAERPLEKDAREVMRDLRPRLEEALAALGRIEGRDGGLAERELARRRAFRTLLEAVREQP